MRMGLHDSNLLTPEEVRRAMLGEEHPLECTSGSF